MGLPWLGNFQPSRSEPCTQEVALLSHTGVRCRRRWGSRKLVCYGWLLVLLLQAEAEPLGQRQGLVRASSPASSCSCSLLNLLHPWEAWEVLLHGSGALLKPTLQRAGERGKVG